ncbi:hypothetical protein LTR02_008348 [Friedmanniomyces endolithicus]|nr:hypothetical protein LTR94_003707 [Friedmanniomyces endolithicus]KAK0775882.1 hypothetical protein LTR59_014373 [Friedmanniomyces endolithicus]KAK0814067.1 hypothetical protein LTR38_002842 [Friedmanniomyces endolithicus]KAK0820624.1 hypothetical protein LTR75_001502 [Friedmanniomyces endolithicus]KAK0857892.1 hypothetical protein LTR03_000458 [Friedmanniomyces endolithicus]
MAEEQEAQIESTAEQSEQLSLAEGTEQASPSIHSLRAYIRARGQRSLQAPRPTLLAEIDTFFKLTML